MDILATFPSTQAALGAERTLLAEGLPVELIPVPSQVRGDCGFCLLVRGAEDPPGRLERLRACGARELWRVATAPAGPTARKVKTYERNA
jgi:hypothetical protein